MKTSKLKQEVDINIH